MLEIGDRCIVIRSVSGDEGALVEVVGFIPAPPGGGDIQYEGSLWDASYNVVVEALGSPLHSVNIFTGRRYTHRSRPYPEEWLRKLPDVKAEEPELAAAE